MNTIYIPPTTGSNGIIATTLSGGITVNTYTSLFTITIKVQSLKDFYVFFAPSGSINKYKYIRK
jgi:hypothetical protein